MDRWSYADASVTTVVTVRCDVVLRRRLFMEGAGLLRLENVWLLDPVCSPRLLEMRNKPSCPSLRFCAGGLGYSSSPKIPSSDSPAPLRR
jgi:hypothetical protein